MASRLEGATVRDPSWRAALAGTLRDPAQAVAVAAATALLVVAVAADVLVVWSSGQAAAERLVAAASDRQLATAGVDLVATVPPDVPEIAAAVDERLDEIDGFDPAVYEITSIGWLTRTGAEAVQPVARANGRIVRAVPFHREGAIESLDVVAGPDATGEVWLPADLADRLDLAPGDPLEVGLEPIGGAARRTTAPTILAGTYATVDGRPAGALADPSVRLPPAPGDLANPAALVLGDAATIDRLGDESDHLQLSTLEAPVTQPPRYEDLQRGVEQLELLQRDLVDAESDVGAMIYAEFNGPQVRITSDIRRLITRAVTTADAVAQQVSGTATAGVLVAVATLAAAVLAAARRRRDQTQLELVQGSAPAAVALRGVLVVAPGIVVGAALGRLTALPVAGLVLPAARVPVPAVDALAARALAVGFAAAGIVFLVRAADAWVHLGVLGGRDLRRSLPVVPMLLVAAGVVTLGVVVGPPRPPTDPLVMLLPVVVIATIAVLVLRALVRLVPSGARAEAAPSATWLARRRLTGQSGRLVAVGAVVATAAGLVAHTAVLRTSGGVAVEAKAAAVAGAAVVVGVPGPTLADGASVPAGLAVVIQDASVRVLPEDAAATLLAVDPASFAAVATWPTGTTADVLDALAAADGTSLPVLAIDGPTPVGDRGTLDRSPSWSLPYEVVGRPAALPGSEPGRSMLLTTQEALFARLDPSLDPRSGPLDPESSDVDGPWRTQVWLDASLDDAIGALAAVAPDRTRGVQVERTLADIEAQPSYLATTWGLGVLGGLGVVVLALALLLLGGTRARADDDAGLELALLQRLGIPQGQQRRAALLERVLLVAVAGTVGVLAGTGLAALVLRGADPAPEVVPPLAVTLPVPALVGVVGALVLGGVVAGLLDHRAARRADVEEALRVAR